MQGAVNQYFKNFRVVAAAPNATGAFSHDQWFDQEKEAREFAARTIATNKGGEALVLKAIAIVKLPMPDVETVEISATPTSK